MNILRKVRFILFINRELKQKIDDVCKSISILEPYKIKHRFRLKYSDFYVKIEKNFHFIYTYEFPEGVMDITKKELFDTVLSGIRRGMGNNLLNRY